jgi:TetR/AcrR family transcriptional regulator
VVIKQKAQFVPPKLRARSDEDKTARRQQLLSAAAELHAERDLDWTMLEVAQKAKLAKGTTYLYFHTKEELLLELLTQELEAWFTELNAWLNSSQAQSSHESIGDDLAVTISQSIASRPRLVALLAVQASILEQNLSFEAALRFKSFLLERSSGIAPHLEQRLPGSHGIETLQWINALVIGLAQLGQPAAGLKPILERREMQALRVDFQSALERSLRALFRGLEP